LIFLLKYRIIKAKVLKKTIIHAIPIREAYKGSKKVNLDAKGVHILGLRFWQFNADNSLNSMFEITWYPYLNAEMYLKGIR